MSFEKSANGCGDYDSEVECIRNIKSPLSQLLAEQRERLLQQNSMECACPRNDDICKKIQKYLPSIISFTVASIIIVSMCLYFGDILCNKDKPLKNPPAF